MAASCPAVQTRSTDVLQPLTDHACLSQDARVAILLSRVVRKAHPCPPRVQTAHGVLGMAGFTAFNHGDGVSWGYGETQARFTVF